MKCRIVHSDHVFQCFYRHILGIICSPSLWWGMMLKLLYGDYLYGSKNFIVCSIKLLYKTGIKIVTTNKLATAIQYENNFPQLGSIQKCQKRVCKCLRFCSVDSDIIIVPIVPLFLSTKILSCIYCYADISAQLLLLDCIILLPGNPDDCQFFRFTAKVDH